MAVWQILKSLNPVKTFRMFTLPFISAIVKHWGEKVINDNAD